MGERKRKMSKTNYRDAYNNPIWIMYECAAGARWTAVKGGSCEHPMDEDCNFSGHQPGHKVQIKGETNDRHIAHDWFRRI